MSIFWKRIVHLYHQLGSPKYFFEISRYLLTPLLLATIGLFTISLISALWLAPADYQMADSFRIIYVHVPSAFLSQSVYFIIASLGAIHLIWRIKMASIIANAVLPVGAAFALLALITGSIWGKPTWGTYWFWDARLISSLVFFFLYLGLIALHAAITETVKADRALAILSLVGLMNIPIIKYSVVWWNTLHQPATLSVTEKPSMQTEMLYPLLLMIVAYYFFFLVLMVLRGQNEILHRESHTKWVKEWVAKR